MPTYHTLYDVRNAGAPAAGALRAGVAGVLVGVLLLAVVFRRKDRAPRLFVLAFILAWTALSAWNGVSAARARREALDWLSRGEAQTAEGRVTDFAPATASGDAETFRVAGHLFRLFEAGSAPGLHQTSLRGGPIQGGAHLRITFRGESILKVEAVEDGGVATKP